MQGGLLNYIIMKTIISARRDILLDVQGSNVWSGQQVQSFNADAISWGALGQQVRVASSLRNRMSTPLTSAPQLYSPSGRYAIVPFSILIGLAVPLPFWIVHRYFPKLGANVSAPSGMPQNPSFEILNAGSSLLLI